MFGFNKKIIISIFSILVILLAHSEIGMFNIVHAQNANSLGVDKAGIQSLVSNIAVINTFLYVILLVGLNMMQYLMSSDFFSNGTMMGALNTIWILSRDIVNVIFALMLVGVAVYTIVTADAKFVKEKLVHFLMAVVLVNFSWFFPRVIIDVSNILTATVFSIPQLLPAGSQCRMIGPDGKQADCDVLVDSMILGNAKQMDEWCTKVEPKEKKGETDCFRNAGFYAWKRQKMDFAMKNGTMTPSTAMLNGLVISFVKVTQLSKVPQMSVGWTAPTGTADDYKTALNILIIILMTFVFLLATILPILGLALGFLIRIVIIWMCIAFMPFTFIGLAVKGSLTTEVFGFEVNLWKQFTSAVFLPAIVGVPIAIGFVMMSTVATIPPPPNFPQNFGLPLMGGVANWWALLWMVAATGILWTGAFTALKKNNIVGKFAEPLQNFGQGIFNAAKQVPLLTPLPIPLMPAGSNVGTALNSAKITGDFIRMRTSRPDSRGLVPAFKEFIGARPDAAAIGNKLDKGQVDRIVGAIDRIKGTTDPAQLSTLIKSDLQTLVPATSRMEPREAAEFFRDMAQRSNATDTKNTPLSTKKGDLDAILAKLPK